MSEERGSCWPVSAVGLDETETHLIDSHTFLRKRVLKHPLLILLITQVTLLGLVSAQESVSPEDLFSDGVALLKQGRLEEAEKVFLEAQQRGLDNALLHHNLGIIHQQQRLHEKAVVDFREALARDPGIHASRGLLGASLLALNRTDEGISELEAAVESIPDNALFRVQLAKAYESTGRALAAVGQYREISKLNPDDPESAYQLGKAYVAASEWCYRTMTETAPNSARVHQAMGQNLMSLGDFEAAERAFQRARNSAPNLPDIRLGLAHALLRQGKLQEALEAVEGELEIVPWNVGAQHLKTQISARLESSAKQ